MVRLRSPGGGVLSIAVGMRSSRARAHINVKAFSSLPKAFSNSRLLSKAAELLIVAFLNDLLLT